MTATRSCVAPNHSNNHGGVCVGEAILSTWEDSILVIQKTLIPNVPEIPGSIPSTILCQKLSSVDPKGEKKGFRSI